MLSFISLGFFYGYSKEGCGLDSELYIEEIRPLVYGPLELIEIVRSLGSLHKTHFCFFYYCRL